MKDFYGKTGRKLSWNEEFIWNPLAHFTGTVIAYVLFFGFLFLITLGIIKLIKFIWYL
jgi:hypothetical protein